MTTLDINPYRERLKRSAIELKIGGFTPPVAPLASWFGRVASGAPGDSWPMQGSLPMLPLCQINLTELPYRPPRLDDIAFLSVFIGPDELPSDTTNGDGWCLRAYKDIDALVPLDLPTIGSPIKQLPIRPHIIDEDFPCWEDMGIELPKEIEDNYYDLFENADGFKLGGWPSLVQAEIYWAPWNEHAASPEFVFQIASTSEGNWQWGDQGVGYFGRGTTLGHEDDWALAWQCY